VRCSRKADCAFFTDPLTLDEVEASGGMGDVCCAIGDGMQRGHCYSVPTLAKLIASELFASNPTLPVERAPYSPALYKAQCLGEGDGAQGGNGAGRKGGAPHSWHRSEEDLQQRMHLAAAVLHVDQQEKEQEATIRGAPQDPCVRSPDEYGRFNAAGALDGAQLVPAITMGPLEGHAQTFDGRGVDDGETEAAGGTSGRRYRPTPLNRYLLSMSTGSGKTFTFWAIAASYARIPAPSGKFYTVYIVAQAAPRAEFLSQGMDLPRAGPLRTMSDTMAVYRNGRKYVESKAGNSEEHAELVEIENALVTWAKRTGRSQLVAGSRFKGTKNVGTEDTTRKFEQFLSEYFHIYMITYAMLGNGFCRHTRTRPLLHGKRSQETVLICDEAHVLIDARQDPSLSTNQAKLVSEIVVRLLLEPEAFACVVAATATPGGPVDYVRLGSALNPEFYKQLGVASLEDLLQASGNRGIENCIFFEEDTKATVRMKELLEVRKTDLCTTIKTDGKAMTGKCYKTSDKTMLAQLFRGHFYGHDASRLVRG
jgi:hypothetical protein